MTALILDVGHEDELVCVPGQASANDLANPAVLCLEAGGAGGVDKGNFDHHDADGPRTPACLQAFDLKGSDSSSLRRLVEYVASVDCPGRRTSQPGERAFLSLSGVFSGMRTATNNPKEQLLAGIDILRTVLDLGLDPWGEMPEQPEWVEFIAAKRRQQARLKELAKTATLFTTQSGRQGGLISGDVPGALGALYAAGCEIAIARWPSYFPPAGGGPIQKYTVARCDAQTLDAVAAELNSMEPGWGGPASGTIIGSPFEGSDLSLRVVQDVVVRLA